MSDFSSFRKSLSSGEKSSSALRSALPECCWPFHGDVYATNLGKGEPLFPEGEEDEEASPSSKPCPYGTIPTPFSHYAGANSDDVVVNTVTRVPLPPFSLPYHYCQHFSQSPLSPTNPGGQHNSRNFSGGKETDLSASSSLSLPYTSKKRGRRQEAARKVQQECHLFFSQARFTTSKGSGVSENADRIGNELWRFRRRGFQDCWMAVFFVFVIIIALLACLQEIRSLSLTPVMRQRMEEQWGLCEFDFAGLHVRENIQRYHDSTSNRKKSNENLTEQGSEQGLEKKRKKSFLSISDNSEAVQKNSKGFHHTTKKIKGGRTAFSVSTRSMYGITDSDTSSHIYRKIGETVTFRSMEALIVGLDYTLCNRVSGGAANKKWRKAKSTSTSIDGAAPIIDFPDSQTLVNGDMDDTSRSILSSRSVQEGEKLGNALSSATPSTWLWEDLGLEENSSAVTKGSKGKNAKTHGLTSEDNNTELPSIRAHRSVQKLLDTYPQTWPIYAMEWKPLLIFEIALLCASPLAIVVLFLLTRFHKHVLPTLLHTGLLLCVVCSFWCVYTYNNLVLAVGLLVIGGAMSWWWWVYGSSRNHLSGVLLQFTGEIFQYPKLGSFLKPRKNQREQASSWGGSEDSAEKKGRALPASTLVYSAASHYPPHYTRFFVFSLFASLIHITNFTIVSLALLPPFFRLFDDLSGFSLKDVLYVLLIVVSDYWLLRVTQVVLEYVACGIVLTLYYNGSEDPPPRTPIKDFLLSALTSHLGAVCTHALLLPPVEMVHRVLSFFTGSSHDYKESKSAIGAMANKLHVLFEKKCYQHVNSFALLHVIMYGCSYDDAARYTWWLLKQEPQLHQHPTHLQKEQRAESSLTGTLLPGERKMSPSFERGNSFLSSHSPVDSSHPGFPPLLSNPSPAGMATLLEVSKSIHHHIQHSTACLTVNVVVRVFSIVVAICTWFALHLYLQCLRASSAVASPLLSAYSSTTSALQSQIKSTVNSDLHKSNPELDISSISIAIVVFFSVSTMLHYYVLIFHAVWISLSLCSLENPFGLACSFPLLLRQIFHAISPFRINEVMEEIEDDEEGEHIGHQEEKPLEDVEPREKTVHLPFGVGWRSLSRSHSLPVSESLNSGYGGTQPRDGLEPDSKKK